MLKWLIERYKDLLLRSLVEGYPGQSTMTARLISRGKKLQGRNKNPLARWNLLRSSPSLGRFIRLTFLLAQNEAYAEWHREVEADAYLYYLDCFFSAKEEANAYFYALHYASYLWSLSRGFVVRWLQWRPKPQNQYMSDYELDYLVLSSVEGSTR